MVRVDLTYARQQWWVDAMLNGVYTPELSASIGKRQLSSTGKLQAPEAKSQIRLR